MASGDFSRRTAWVTSLSFLVVVLVASGAGLIAKHQVVTVVEEHLRWSSVERNRGIAQRVVVSLNKQLARMPRDAVLAQFRIGSLVSTAFGYSLFLIDVASDRVIAHSDYRFTGPYPRPLEMFRSPTRLKADDPPTSFARAGSLLASDPHGEPILLYLMPVDAYWTVGVVSGVHPMKELEQMLSERLVMLLVATVAAIALLGFVAVRGIGRVYERALEHEVRDRTDRLAAAQADGLHKARLAAIGEAASLLAHEMRNPLASIQLGLSELAAAAELDGRQRRRLEIALDQVQRLEELLSEVLDYVRPVRLSPAPVALDKLLDYGLELLEPLLAQHRLRIDRETCPACPAFRLDTKLMTQALVNLIKNAVEASPEGGCIGIVLAWREPSLVLEISNAGPALPDAELQRAFEPFVTSKPLGTGLGLPLVKRVIEEHGGHVHLTSFETGIRCIVVLPAAA